MIAARIPALKESGEMAKYAFLWWLVLKQTILVDLHKLWNIDELAHSFIVTPDTVTIMKITLNICTSVVFLTNQRITAFLQLKCWVFPLFLTRWVKIHLNWKDKCYLKTLSLMSQHLYGKCVVCRTSFLELHSPVLMTRWHFQVALLDPQSGAVQWTSLWEKSVHLPCNASDDFLKTSLSHRRWPVDSNFGTDAIWAS